MKIWIVEQHCTTDKLFKHINSMEYSFLGAYRVKFHAENAVLEIYKSHEPEIIEIGSNKTYIFRYSNMIHVFRISESELK